LLTQASGERFGLEQAFPQWVAALHSVRLLERERLALRKPLGPRLSHPVHRQVVRFDRILLRVVH